MSSLTRAASDTVSAVLDQGLIHSVFQPIVEIGSGAVVAYEALARGPQGPLATPDALFAAAREEGLLAELDGACRLAALRGAVSLGLLAPLTLFVNVEPEVLDTAPLGELLAVAESAPGRLRVVLEITERALATRPADLLRTVERVRSAGWGVALDDVGAHALSLAFMPLLAPDVVKLDLRLVQGRPGPAVAEIVNAVNAYAERSGALLLAEGIENSQHVLTAQALGATLGQGWHYGRPAASGRAGPVAELVLPVAPTSAGASLSPFACLPAGVPLRVSSKRLLIEISKQLEREAMRVGETSVVASTFQEARHFTPATVARYRDLVARAGFVCALGDGLAAEPMPGVRGAHLDATDPVRGEWDVAVLGPHFAAALLARDLGDTGPDLDRRFEFALTYDRHVVARATGALLARVVPQLPRIDGLAPAPAAVPSASAVPAQRRTAGRAPRTGEDGALLERALAATNSGVTIADMTRPDYPLIFANRGFEQLSGVAGEDLLGRNCRFLQGPDSDPAAIQRIRAGVLAGQEVRETILNYRGASRTPWWNEVFLSPLHDADGQLVQYIGVQQDVTARVSAEQALLLERDRAQSYLARIEQQALTDPLTGLANRRGLERALDQALGRAQTSGTGLALLFVDLDAFKAVNDRHGHSAGDTLLVEVGRRLRSRLRKGDMLARLGGDEFLVALPDLELSRAGEHARRVADALSAVVRAPIALDDVTATVGASIGIALYPGDGLDFAALLHASDMSMYAVKRPA